ncbi:hypothetical protein HY412_00345 [Candidatus Kaiserbacteria bacterium]|nr:hypothetical protein [Candidatus Kaiserbacteria bacterium]
MNTESGGKVSLTILAILILCFVGIAIFALFPYFSPDSFFKSNTEVLSTYKCDDFNIDLRLTVHTNYIEGDSISYSLVYHDGKREDVFHSEVYQLPIFHPLPVDPTIPVKVFELPSKDFPSLINIFIPGNTSESYFNSISACLERYQAKINSDLELLPNSVPEKDRGFYTLQRLGGIAHIDIMDVKNEKGESINSSKKRLQELISDLDSQRPPE